MKNRGAALVSRIRDAAGVAASRLVGSSRAVPAGDAASASAPAVEKIESLAICTLDTHGTISSWNAGAERLMQFTSAEAVGRPLSSFYILSDRAAGYPQHLLAEAPQRGQMSTRREHVRKDGSSFPAAVTIEPIREGGRLQGFVYMLRDATGERETEEQLARLSANLDIALAHMQRGLCLYDAAERLVLANDRMSEIYGFDPGDLRPGMSYAEVLEIARERHGSTPKQSEASARSAYETHRRFMLRPEGGSLTAEYHDGKVLAVHERPLPDGGWVSVIEDISERHHAAQRIRHLATHDSLTGLPDRNHFQDMLGKAIEAVASSGERVALAVIDVDRFKDINDIYGHAMGNGLLRLIASAIGEALDGTGIVARTGGDEFALCRIVDGEEEIDRLVDRLTAALDRTFAIDGAAIVATAGIGMALYPDDGATPGELAANADLALQRAKSSRERGVCRYRHDMGEDARARRSLLADLRDALDAGQLRLVYQVQCLVESGAAIGYEALLRWEHPVLGDVPPARFIPLAEDDGLIVPIGEWVLRQACRDAAGWSQPHKVAVNISPVQLGRIDLPERIAEALLEAGLPASRLEIEITESALIADKLRALHTLRRIKALGVTVAIDDFGTGYASLDTLHAFEFDKIKIDRSFLIEGTHKPQARAIIRAVLALGRNLGLPVLAEGVETAEHLDLLREERCAEAQGYYFGMPGEIVDDGGRMDGRRSPG